MKASGMGTRRTEIGILGVSLLAFVACCVAFVVAFGARPDTAVDGASTVAADGVLMAIDDAETRLTGPVTDAIERGIAGERVGIEELCVQECPTAVSDPGSNDSVIEALFGDLTPSALAVRDAHVRWNDAVLDAADPATGEVSPEALTELAASGLLDDVVDELAAVRQTVEREHASDRGGVTWRGATLVVSAVLGLLALGFVIRALERLTSPDAPWVDPPDTPSPFVT